MKNKNSGKRGEPVVSLREISKIYKLYRKPTDRLKEVFVSDCLYTEKKALDNITFEIGNREAVGIIGSNGAGKSTLLKLLTGVIKPSSGEMSINGKISAILELGAGFNMERSGIENIEFSCTLMGYSDREIVQRIELICDFADIGEYIYQPMKLYSSGMIARVAFATAINVDPDVLIVDEALSVGDAFFQAKSVSKMKDLVKNKTVIFVSHSMDTIRSFCKRAIYLKDGAVYMDGDVRTITQQYETDNNMRLAKLNRQSALKSLVDEQSDNHLPTTESHDTDFLSDLVDETFDHRVKAFRAGTGEVRFVRADLLVNGKITHQVPFGANVTILVYFKCLQTMDQGATVGYTIRNQNGVDLFGYNIYNKIELLPAMQPGDIFEVKIEFKNILAPAQNYVIGFGLKPRLHDTTFTDNIYSAITFDVPALPDRNWVPGLLYVDQSFKVRSVNSKRKGVN